MLTEDKALALLQRYFVLRDCGPLFSARLIDTYFARHQDWTDAVREIVDIVVVGLWGTDDYDMRGDGARLRLALEVAYAVSCCRGFEPVVNPAFWRRIVPTWSEQPHPERLALLPSALQHVGTDIVSNSAFWNGFLHGTPESVAALTAVLNDLQPHVNAPVMPPLHVSLSSCHTANATPPTRLSAGTCVAPDALDALLEAALRTPDHLQWPVSTTVGLVVECCVDYDASAMRTTLGLLHRARTHAPPHLRFAIDRLDIQLEPLVPPKVLVDNVHYQRALVTRSRALGETLRRTLVDVKRPFPVSAVALLECNLSDFRLVAAALSAVALAATPVQELRCGWLFDVPAPCHHLQRLAWLAYALQCRHRRLPSVPLALSLRSSGMVITEHECEYMQILMARGTPLRDVVGEALRLRCGGDDALVAQLTVECLRVGSRVRLARGSRLFVEPFRGDDGSVAVVTETDEELEWVAHVADHGGCVGVVYGGYGLVWVEASAVTAWHRHDDDVAMTDTFSGIVALSSFALGFDGDASAPPALQSDAYRVTATVALLGCQSLTSLSIDNAVILESDLVQLLAACRFLETLKLDLCLIESLEPLVAAYAAGTTRIASLSLVGANDLRLRNLKVTDYVAFHRELAVDTDDNRGAAWTAPFVDALASGVARGVLRELKIDVADIRPIQAERQEIEKLADAVATSALPLERLHVYCHRQAEDTCVARLAPLCDAVLADPPRVRCAILSVLTRVGCPLREVAPLVLALAEGSIVRIVTWELVTP